MIDLSYLTEEEKERILGVLKRDAELKAAEEQRIKNLQSSVQDKSQLKYLTGDWFYETKSRRHRDRIHGSDIIRASIRQRKPVTILELSQVWPETPSFVNSDNQEVFVPPELCGLIEEPPLLLSYEREEKSRPSDRPQDTMKTVLQSPPKQRLNPFDSSPESLVLDGQLTNGSMEQTKTPDRDQLKCGYAEPLNPQVSDFHLTEQESGKPDRLGAGTEDDGHAMAKVREQFGWSLREQGIPEPQLPEHPSDKAEVLVVAVSDAKSSSDAGSKNVEESHAVSPKPRKGLLGIFSRGETKEKSPEAPSPVEKEVTTSEERELDDAISKFVNAQSAASTTMQPQPKHPEQLTDKPEILAVAISGAKSPSDAGSKKSSHPVSPKPQKGLLGIFRRRESKEKNPEAQSPVKEDVTTSEERQLHKPVANLNQTVVTTTQQYQQETDTQTRRDETVEMAEFQSKDLIKLVSSVVDKNQHEVVGGEADTFPKKLSNLKSFMEEENSDPKTLTGKPSSDATTQKHAFIGHGDPCDHENLPKTESRKVSLCLHNILDLDSSGMRHFDDVESNDNAISQQIDVTHEDEASPSVECSLFLNTPSVDGTFMARPVPIINETDCPPEGLTADSEMVKQQEELATSLSVLPSSLSSKQQSVIPETCLGAPPSGQESSTAKIIDLKENIGPRIVVGKPKEPSDGQTQPCSEKPPVGPAKVLASSQSDLGTTEMGYQEKSSSPYTSMSSTQERPSITPLPRSPILKLKDPTDDEVKRSPSKTCHPKALPKESTHYKGSGHDYSPLKTFLIDIAPPPKECVEDVEKPTPMVRQIKSPSHEAKQVVFSPEDHQQYSLTLPQRDSLTAMKTLQDPTQSIPFPGRTTSLGNLNVQQGPFSSHQRDPNVKRKSEDGAIGQQLAGTSGESENDLDSSLARSFVPQNYQGDVGFPRGTHIPRCEKEQHVVFTAPVLLLDDGHNPASSLTDSEESQNTERSEHGLWSVQNVDSGSSSGSSTPTVQSGASPGSSHDDPSPVRAAALKQMSSNLMASSKSLEDITSRLTLAATPPPSHGLSESEQMKLMSTSVPDLPQDEKDGRDSDRVSETSFSLGRRTTASSLTNLSLSSGMASMSSVSGSVVSLYNVDFGDVEVKGTIRFALNYVQKLGEFHIFVVHCRELAMADPKKKRSDPYVKCYLLPDKAKMGKRKTSVKKKSLNPTYNEILRFKVTMETLMTQTLNVSVWHHDSFGRNHFLGQVDMDFSKWDFSNTQMNDYALKARASTQTPSQSLSIDHKGEMRLALRFLQQASYSKRSSKTLSGEVQVWVKDCKNLPPSRGVIIDPFVKCTVLPDSSRKSRQKTRVVKRTASPMFNHTMVFHGFRLEDLPEACVELTVWDHDRLSNHFIGGLRIGPGSGRSYGAEVDWMDSTPEEARLWERMVQSQGEWVEEVLPLRMLMMARHVSK